MSSKEGSSSSDILHYESHYLPHEVLKHSEKYYLANSAACDVGNSKCYFVCEVSMSNTGHFEIDFSF